MCPFETFPSTTVLISNEGSGKDRRRTRDGDKLGNSSSFRYQQGNGH